MSRRRYLSTDVSIDPRVNRLAAEYGDFAALLYTWMIPHAADDATITGDPEQLLLMVIPGRRDKSPDDIAAATAGMVVIGLLELTEDGRLRFPPKSFYRYQTYIQSAKRADTSGDQPGRDMHTANRRKSPQISA